MQITLRDSIRQLSRLETAYNKSTKPVDKFRFLSAIVKIGNDLCNNESFNREIENYKDEIIRKSIEGM